MKFAIIAAGEGSRLATEGITQPKPLIPLCGVPMIERLISIFHRCGAEEIIVAVNSARPETHQYLLEFSEANPTFPLRIVVADTPSSMHTFAALAPYLQEAPFCLTTVDTIFQEEAFRAYLHAAKQYLHHGYDGCMAVTDFVDDESPLYIATTSQFDITGFHDKITDTADKTRDVSDKITDSSDKKADFSDKKADFSEESSDRDKNHHVDSIFISGGIYTLSPKALTTLSRCMAEGQHRLRNFQRGLIADGLKLKAYLFDKILDIDHASDIAKAESFLQEGI